MIATRFLSAFLALCLIATSGVMAMSRIDPGTGQFVTICANGKSVTVELDHTGAPVTPAPHCPDCVTGAVLTPDLPDLAPILTETRLSTRSTLLSQAVALQPMATARAPPCFT